MDRSQGKVVVNTAVNGEQYFNIVAENGKILASSETYTSKAGLLKGIKAVTDLFTQDDLIIEGLDNG